MTALNLGVIGNGTIGALVDPLARIVWGCFPRLDGDPVFSALVDQAPDGSLAPEASLFAIELIDQYDSRQHYLPNSAVLVTTLSDRHGGVVEITDFCPRFRQFDRAFRPPMIVRRIAPLQGAPRLRLRLRLRFDYGATTAEITRGSNHIRYVSAAQALRLTTDMPVSSLLEETPFVLDRPLTLIFGPDESFTAAIGDTARLFLERTLGYWHEWVRGLSIPFEWQDAVIRAAITLKLCNFEETGAIVAALTTSIPEAPGTSRNWDYRFCWLRDAYFVIQALNRLGVTETMEGFLGYLGDIAADADAERHPVLHPVYAITRSHSRLVERTAPALRGYRGMGPVRLGNQAFEQVQNDVYGSVVLAATHAFFDRRLVLSGPRLLFERLERLGLHAVAVFNQPDAGPWELRTSARIHTFSAVMCWAACDRLARIAGVLGLADREQVWRQHAATLQQEILARAWNADRGHFCGAFEGNDLDATLLLLPALNFLPGSDPRFVATVEAIGRDLRTGDFLYRYVVADDFGTPGTAFTICTYWYIDALAAIGREAEARELFQHMLSCRNPLGLLSEDIDPADRSLWGNFPQTYSMVGLINSAMRLSRSWEEAF